MSVGRSARSGPGDTGPNDAVRSDTGSRTTPARATPKAPVLATGAFGV